MKTIWFVFVLSVSAALEMQAQIVEGTNDATFAGAWSLSQSNAAFQEVAEQTEQTLQMAPVFDSAAFLEDAQETNKTSQLAPLAMPITMGASPALVEIQTEAGGESGLQSRLSVSQPILNIDFGDNTKVGFAAIGQSGSDYWNPVMPYFGLGTVQNLLWSDQSASTADVTVGNAPGQWGNSLCLDPMYLSFIYPWNAGHITVTLTELPAGTYDFYVYATRASENGAPVIELKRDGASLQTKGTTLWGNGWYSASWDEGEQYVRFRNIAVNNQTIVLDVYPDAAGYASISGLQIVPSSAVPSEQRTISKLMNINFGGLAGAKVGAAAVGMTGSDYWNPYTFNGYYSASVQNLAWADQSVSTADMTVWNSPGAYGVTLFDPMLSSWKYAYNGGNTTITVTDLPAGNCDIYLYTPQIAAGHNSIYELWSDEVNQGIKGTTLWGYTAPVWEPVVQYVLFKDVTVSEGKLVIVQVKHASDGYQYISGMQIAYKGTGPVDTDADGLPDAWEMKWFGNLDQTATADPDGDGLSNLREYQLALDPLRFDSNANGIRDSLDAEIPWIEDAVPQGGYPYTYGGDSWNWVTSMSGWGGGTVLPHSGAKMHMSANVANAAHQHYWERAVSVIRPGVGDVLYAWVNLDPTYPPAEVMLQFQIMESNGSYSWERRAYWGANNIAWGTDGTVSRYHVGSLPAAGQWVRLEVPASVLGLEGKIIEGMAFTLYGGRAAWDRAGKITPDMDGDGLPDSWELQYFGNLNQNGGGDYEGDGLTNLQEYQLGANPSNADTDADGLPDGWEVTHGLNPLANDANLDFDNDALKNLEEYKAGTDPTNPDTDGDGRTDWQELTDGTNPLDPASKATWPIVADGPLPSPPPPLGGCPTLTISFQNGEYKYSLSGGDSGVWYDLYGSANLSTWTWLSRVEVGNLYRLIDPTQYMFFYDLDCDGDGLRDSPEGNSYYTDPGNPDSDGDGISDGDEVFIYNTNPSVPDSAIPATLIIQKCPL